MNNEGNFRVDAKKFKKPDYLIVYHPSENNYASVNIRYVILSQLNITEFRLKKLLHKPPETSLTLEEIFDFFNIQGVVLIKGKVRVNSILNLNEDNDNPLLQIVRENGYPTRLIFLIEELSGPYLMTRLSSDMPEKINHIIINVDKEEYAVFRLKFWSKLEEIRNKMFS